MMNKSVLIIAPHADDETLGCGGTILKLVNAGCNVYWLLVTGMSERAGFSPEQIEKRSKQIVDVTKAYRFAQVYELDLPPAQLDILPKSEIISPICRIINDIKPEIVFTAFRNDAHSDHEIVFDATMAATKSFRYPFIKKVMAYETMSETDFGSKPESGGFKPNVFIDISGLLEEKLNILEMFESEVHDFPFPRSRKALKSLAHVRGAQCGSDAAEAFFLIKEIL